MKRFRPKKVLHQEYRKKKKISAVGPMILKVITSAKIKLNGETQLTTASLFHQRSKKLKEELVSSIHKVRCYRRPSQWSKSQKLRVIALFFKALN